DGKLLAFTATGGGSVQRIYVQQTAGGDAIPITGDTEDAVGEDFSPDGTHIVFVSKDALYIAPTLSGEAKLLASGGGGYPHFSPDGHKVLYWRDLSAMLVSVDSGEQVSPQLNKDFLVQAPPEWAPTGDAILFFGVRRHDPQKAGEYWVASLTSGEVEK